MVLTKKFDLPVVIMGGKRLLLVDGIRLLGVTIDIKLSFGPNVTLACIKVLNIYKQIACVAKLTRGLKPEVVRTIYTVVIEPIVLYAATLWAPAVSRINIKKHLVSVQRCFAQKMFNAYRTVYLNAVLALSGLVPLDIRVHKCARLYDVKRRRRILELADHEYEGRIGFAEPPHPAVEE